MSPTEVAEPFAPATDVKQVIVVRKDLKMRKGKMCAQSAHATQRSLTHRRGAGIRRNDGGGWELVVPLTEDDRVWLETEYKKIVLGVDTEDELLELHRRALEAGLHCDLVVDNGHTEFHGQKTRTVLVIGPHAGAVINRITGHLDPL